MFPQRDSGTMAALLLPIHDMIPTKIVRQIEGEVRWPTQQIQIVIQQWSGHRFS
jgi:hypothetical protein